MPEITFVTVAFAIAIIFLAGDSSAKDLRPSEHGLVFQTLSPTGARSSSPEMKSFFNTKNSSPSSTTSSDVALPRAMNSGGSAPPSWIPAGKNGGGGDRVEKALVAASVVCGIAGAVLLVASGLIYLLKFKYRTKCKPNAAFRSCDEDENRDSNKLQLVVRNP